MRDVQAPQSDQLLYFPLANRYGQQVELFLQLQQEVDIRAENRTPRGQRDAKVAA